MLTSSALARGPL